MTEQKLDGAQIGTGLEQMRGPCVSMGKRGRLIVILLTVIVAAAASFAYLFWRGMNDVAHLQPGMVTLHLPSGATAYVRRQSQFRKAAEVYLSASADFCAPYDRSHDFKLPNVIQGGTEFPLLLSYQGNTIVLHGPKQILRPERASPSSFDVIYEELTPEVYSAYVGSDQQSQKLPEGWVRVEVPFGHNTCAL